MCRNHSNNIAVRRLHAWERFAQQNFSPKVIDALVAAGIDAPERLLSMSPERVRLLPGVGPKTSEEVERYRKNYS